MSAWSRAHPDRHAAYCRAWRKRRGSSVAERSRAAERAKRSRLRADLALEEFAEVSARIAEAHGPAILLLPKRVR
jgi:hypothetical protein